MTASFSLAEPLVHAVSSRYCVIRVRLEPAVPLCWSASPRSHLQMPNNSRLRAEVSFAQRTDGRRASSRRWCALIWCDRSARSLPCSASHWSQLKVAPERRRRSTNFHWDEDTGCFQAFGCSNHILPESGRSSTFTSCGPISCRAKAKSRAKSSFQAPAGIGVQERHQRGSGVHQPCCQSRSLHADRFLTVENAQASTYFLRTRRNVSRLPPLIGNGREKCLVRVLHGVSVRSAEGVPSAGTVKHPKKGEPHERNPWAPGIEEQPLEEISRQADCNSQVAWN